MTTHRLFPYLLAALSTLASFAPATLGRAPLPQRSDDRIVQDMEFARRLAERFRYIDLAEEVIRNLESEGLRGENLEGLGLLRCDVYAAGASREGDQKKRLALFDKAVGSYRRFLGENPTSELLAQAQRSYIELVNSYGRSLETALDEALGADAEELREKIVEVLQDGLDLAQELIGDIETDASQTQKLAQARLKLNRAQMLFTRAKASEEGTFFFGVAERTLEKLALDYGETSGPGLNAYVLLGKVKRAQGESEFGADYLSFVAETAMPLDPDDKNRAWKNQEFEVRQGRFRLVELATADLVDCLADAGKMESACLWAMHFYNGWRREGFDLSSTGYLSLLSIAAILVDSNGVIGGNRGHQRWFASAEEAKAEGLPDHSVRSALELALGIAQEINENNRKTTLQIRAQKLISAITSRPDISFSPDILFEAAEGEYNARDYHRAIAAYKTILSKIDEQDEATQREFAPKVFYRIGSSLARLDRDLEAAMAFREAATVWSGDPEYQRKVADGYFSSIGAVRRGANNDPIIERMYLEAESIVEEAAKETGGADEVRWRKAERLYARTDWTSARNGYREVSAASDKHEKAISKAAVCLYKMKDIKRAEEEFQDYVDQYVKQAENVIVGATKRSARHQARAQATYYLAAIAFAKNDFAAVLERCKGYEKEFADQGSYASNALYLVTRSHLGNNDLESAKAAQAILQESFPASRRTGQAAKFIADALAAEVERLEKDGDADGAMGFRTEQAHYTQIDNQLASSPAFANLRAESKLWLEVGHWSSAEKVLNRIFQVFGNEPERADDMTNFILPDLGWALLEQKRVPEAFDILDPLIPRDETDTRKPRSDVVRRWCRAVTGWVEGNGRLNAEQPGVGGTENLELAADYLLKLTQSQKNKSGGWDCPWYELKFDMAYAYLQWGKEDSTRTKTARGVIQNLLNNFDDARMGQIRKACGDEVLQKRFLWLWEKLK